MEQQAVGFDISHIIYASLFLCHQKSNLDQYRKDGETFPDVIVRFKTYSQQNCVFWFQEYKGKNLLDIHDYGDHTRFARQLLKLLFTPAELSQSILYANTTYAKPGLDVDRMKLFRGKN